MNIVCRITSLLWILFATTVIAGKYTKTRVSTRLYTPADPNASGGIQAQVEDNQVLEVLAIRSNNPKQVYKGKVSADGTEFIIKGLPIAKYDLLIVCADHFYEGLTLATDPDSLTSRDHKLLEFIINKSEPFFNVKKIQRIAGQTGRKGKARGVVQQVRTRPVKLQSGATRTDIQIRSIRLTFLEDVGKTGWQLMHTREIVRTEVGPPDVKGVLPHTYMSEIGGIRVVDSVKDLGILELENSTK